MSLILQRLRGRMAKPYSRFKEIIPFVFTFANVSFGFFSIVKTIEGDFVVAALCIMAAALMDAIDGRLARYLGTAGALGSELDSLCDAVSFCLAPAVLLYSWYLHDFGHAGLFVSALILYLCAGLLRLARFNLSTKDQNVFSLGLPTTIAAFFFAQLVLYQEFFSGGSLNLFLNEKVLVGLVASMAFLMISSVRFPVFKKANLSLRHSATYVKIAIVLGLILWCLRYGYPFFLMVVSAYIVGSLFANGFVGVKKALKKWKQR
jgi:CDP-diacylglycerol--serine O-phosphatidyltransferase